jgi:hypothetical protein
MKEVKSKLSLDKLIFILSFLFCICGCSSFERNEIVEGKYYPDGTVKLDCWKASNNQVYTLTTSEPILINEIGVYTLKFTELYHASYMRGGFQGTFDAGKTEIQDIGECYIPIAMLNNSGKFKYHKRTLNIIEWIQFHPYFSIFNLLILLVIISIWTNHKANIRQQNERETEERRLKQIREEQEAKECSHKLNSILAKSEEIANKILPYYELLAKESIECANYEFTENAFSPFWSEIEKASKFLACYKEALTQLCMNSELYNHIILENKKYNFSLPFPFPFVTNISIPKTILDEYHQTIRKAQKVPTFSIIWEQRRNTEILIAGFRTLESTIADMSNQITIAITDLNNSISSGLDSIKYIQEEQIRTFESSTNYLQATLNSMDNKLYYIQWKQKPPGTFFPR